MTVADLAVESYLLPPWSNGDRVTLVRWGNTGLWAVMSMYIGNMNARGAWEHLPQRSSRSPDWRERVLFRTPDEALTTYLNALEAAQAGQQ